MDNGWKDVLSCKVLQVSLDRLSSQCKHKYRSSVSKSNVRVSCVYLILTRGKINTCQVEHYFCTLLSIDRTCIFTGTDTYKEKLPEHIANKLYSVHLAFNYCFFTMNISDRVHQTLPVVSKTRYPLSFTDTVCKLSTQSSQVYLRSVYSSGYLFDRVI